MIKYGPAGRFRRGRAIRFLVAGGERQPWVEARARAFEDMARRFGAGSMRLWWARRGREAVAAACILEAPGRAGTLFYSPPGSPGVDRHALVNLVRAVTGEALAGGACLVQRLLAPTAGDEAAMLESAGYLRLAEIMYMRLRISGEPAAFPQGRISWKGFSPSGERELAALIEATYEGTLDCPALSGVRRPAEILAAHKSSGIFTPRWWRTAECDGKAAGCVLLNLSEDGRAAEVVYLGVVPEFRRMGIARAMLRRAVADARGEGLGEMRLAVDAANTYAIRLYEGEGFETTDARVAYAAMRQRDAMELPRRDKR